MNHESMLAALRLSEGLGPTPLDHEYLRRLCADGLLWHSEGMPERTLCEALPQALDEIERLRAALVELTRMEPPETERANVRVVIYGNDARDFALRALGPKA